MKKAFRRCGLASFLLLGGLLAWGQDQPAAQAGEKNHLQGPLSGLGWDTSVKRPMPRQLPKHAADDVDFRVEVSVKYMELEGKSRFLVANGSQANQVNGGEKVYPVKTSMATSVEFKKWGFVVNMLPTLDPADPERVSVQLQIELSGPVKSATAPSSDMPDLGTWQYQSSFSVVRGRKTVIVDEPARVELTIEEVKK